MIEAFRLATLARPIAWRRTESFWPFEVAAALVTLIVILALLGPVGPAYLIALAAFGLQIDVVATLLALAYVGLEFALIGPGFGQPALGVALPLGALVILNLPTFSNALRVPFPTEPWPTRLALALFDVAASPVRAPLMALSRYGYRPELRAQVEAEARRLRIRRERLRWRNWGRTAECRPQIAYLPETLQDLQEIVREAGALGRRVRVAAQGHSWPALSTTDDVLVISHRLDKASVDLSDPQRPLLVAEAGATNWSINDVLEQNGLTLGFNVVLESVRIGGLVATGSHGSGWDTPTLADLVETIEIVDASGELVSYSEATHGAETMRAVRLNLGLFGIIYRVHMRVEPDYRIHQTDRRVALDEMLSSVATLAPRHEALDIYYWPHQKVATLRVWDRTDAPAVAKTRKTFRRVWGEAGFAYFHMLEQWIMRTWPKTVPAIAAFNYPFVPHHDRVTDVREAIHWRDAIELLRVSCVEFAFKLDPDFDSFKLAWRDAMEVIEDYRQRGLYPFNMAINARFIGSSDCLLAPNSGPGHTCYIEILSSTPTPHWEEFTSRIALRWMKLPGARPHWAKEWEFIPGIETFIQEAYGDELHRFLAIRDRLGVDPGRMFSNALMDRLLFAAVKIKQDEPRRVPETQIS